VAAAKNNAIVAFDNLSGISAAMADDICRLATGGGFGGRQFYTEDQEKVFDARRPVIVNGIGDLATRGDLADRSIEVRLERVSHYRGDAEMQAAFDYAAPRILAGVLDMVVLGLRRLEEVKRRHPDLPRMADFALWGRAVAPALGWTDEDFAFAHKQAIKATSATALANDPVAPFLIEFLETRQTKRWSGRPHELWRDIEERYQARALPSSFPRTPEGMSQALRRLEPQLRSRGVTIEWPPSANRRRPMVITMAGDDAGR
jgi:putative DNA primase/helicase